MGRKPVSSVLQSGQWAGVNQKQSKSKEEEMGKPGPDYKTHQSSHIMAPGLLVIKVVAAAYKDNTGGSKIRG